MLSGDIVAGVTAMLWMPMEPERTLSQRDVAYVENPTLKSSLYSIHMTASPRVVVL